MDAAAKPRPPKPPPDKVNERVAALSKEIAQRKQIREYQRRLRKMIDAPHGTLIVAQQDYLDWVKLLHEDTVVDPVMKRRLTQAFQILNKWKKNIETVDPE